MCIFFYSPLLGPFQLKLFHSVKVRQNFASNVTLYPCERSHQNHLDLISCNLNHRLTVYCLSSLSCSKNTTVNPENPTNDSFLFLLSFLATRSKKTTDFLLVQIVFLLVLITVVRLRSKVTKSFNSIHLESTLSPSIVN